MGTVEKMFTPVELAKLLGTSTAALLQWRKKGVGPRVTRMGYSGPKSKVRYMESDVLEWQANLPKDCTNNTRSPSCFPMETVMLETE